MFIKKINNISVGRNEYLKEMNYFNPWISSEGFITWVFKIIILLYLK